MFRAVAYIETEVYQRLLRKLAERGMTFSGWVRAKVAEFLDEKEGKGQVDPQGRERRRG